MRDINRLFSLAGRSALVTGGAGPLGQVLAETLAAQGARVIVSDRDEAACERVSVAITAEYGVDCVPLAVDLLSPDGVADLVSRLEGPLHVVVNNAAFTGTAGIPGYAVPFEDQTDAAFSMAATLNLQVPFSLVRELAPRLRESGAASVVNVSSIYGLVAPNMGLYEGTVMGNPAAYGATKGGIVQLTRYLATALAPDIRVNAFAPGGIARGQAEEFLERYERLTPLGRMATEDDFRGVIAWLASDASRYVTGQTIAVDGGWTAW
jgi:NAD(P)-dependent dehydrogenase (short-subunit alcohol dehydrogenase family)